MKVRLMLVRNDKLRVMENLEHPAEVEVRPGLKSDGIAILRNTNDERKMNVKRIPRGYSLILNQENVESYLIDIAGTWYKREFIINQHVHGGI